MDVAMRGWQVHNFDILCINADFRCSSSSEEAVEEVIDKISRNKQKRKQILKMMNIMFHTCCKFIHVASRKDMYKTIIKLLEEIRYKQSMQPYISADFNVKGDIYAYYDNINNNIKKSKKQKRSKDDLQLLVNIEININCSSNNAIYHKYTPCYLTRDENSAINMFYLGMHCIYNNGGRPDEFQYKEKRSNMIQTNTSTSLPSLHGNRLMEYDGIDAHRTPITKKRPNTNSHPSNNNDDNDFEREINEL